MSYELYQPIKKSEYDKVINNIVSTMILLYCKRDESYDPDKEIHDISNVLSIALGERRIDIVNDIKKSLNQKINLMITGDRMPDVEKVFKILNS